MAESFDGSCHCGALRFVFTTALPPSRWRVRACQCSFCRAHGARTTSDPAGAVQFRIADATSLVRYRFGLRTAEFLVCGRCGTYVAAVVTTKHGRFATINLNALERCPDGLLDAEPVAYDRETEPQRIARRERAWTPVAGNL